LTGEPNLGWFKSDRASKLVFVYTSLRLRERHLSYQRHLDLMVGGARITPAPVESIEDRVDGNASDTDREDCSPASDSDDE
jgi:hypothetical protein